METGVKTAFIFWGTGAAQGCGTMSREASSGLNITATVRSDKSLWLNQTVAALFVIFVQQSQSS